ncbi:hypothetical protein V5799_022121 [Amblyomma americanum]|uniref:Uncharacterized protein n=1 Tax=Amblyomma americanum TaxID=6943 RepID=A0AAQ4FMX6_AMBAM
MSQRNFPASFWNCHQTPSGGSPSHGMGGGVSSPVDLYTGSEPHAYHAHHAHHHASAANAAALHASLQSDPWHYALTAPQAGPYRSSAMHELAYSAGGAHRFGAAAQQYGSLLLQPRSSRLGSVSATCTALDKGDAWASPAARYHHDQLAAAAGHHVVDASGYQAAHHHYGSMGAAAAAAAMTDPNSGGYMLELYKFQAMHAYRAGDVKTATRGLRVKFKKPAKTSTGSEAAPTLVYSSLLDTQPQQRRRRTPPSAAKRSRRLRTIYDGA